MKNVVTVETNESFSISDLHRALAIEVTRADSSFVRSQVAARKALARDLEPHDEMINISPLAITRIEFELAIVPVVPNWLIRTERWVWKLMTGEKPIASELRFRFASTSEGGVHIIKCILQRDLSGRFRISADEINDA